MCRREGDADRKNWRFVKHVFRHHNEVANDWAEKWAKGEKIRCMTRKTNGCEVLKEVGVLGSESTTASMWVSGPGCY